MTSGAFRQGYPKGVEYLRTRKASQIGLFHITHYPPGVLMPFSKIEVCRSRTPEQVQALIESVHQSLREAFKIPECDRHIRYIEHKPEHFAIPPDKSENYTLVEITLFPGRSPQAKKVLFRSIVTRFETLGIPRSDVYVVLNEQPLENWGLRGGIPASDLDLGFKLDV
jgi:phenylpyruvate tautomerase PptA (4-oxalocrotonate tautomerase family)